MSPDRYIVAIYFLLVPALISCGVTATHISAPEPYREAGHGEGPGVPATVPTEPAETNASTSSEIADSTEPETGGSSTSSAAPATALPIPASPTPGVVEDEESLAVDFGCMVGATDGNASYREWLDGFSGLATQRAINKVERLQPTPRGVGTAITNVIVRPEGDHWRVQCDLEELHGPAAGAPFANFVILVEVGVVDGTLLVTDWVVPGLADSGMNWGEGLEPLGD